MKKRSKFIVSILSAIFIVILGALVWFFHFYEFGYKMTVPFRPGYTKIAENVYVYEGYGIPKEEILYALDVAKQRVNNFFGEIKSNPTIILCDDESELSFHRGATQTALRSSYISIGSELFGVDVAAHELTHAETHRRIQKPMWVYIVSMNFTYSSFGIPIWFDEGVAIQNDYREKYGEETWIKDTNNGETATALSDMDIPEKFYSGDDDDGCKGRFHYMCAKHEVAEWIKKHGKEALFELMDEISKGTEFSELYFKN